MHKLTVLLLHCSVLASRKSNYNNIISSNINDNNGTYNNDN